MTQIIIDLIVLAMFISFLWMVFADDIIRPFSARLADKRLARVTARHERIDRLEKSFKARLKKLALTLENRLRPKPQSTYDLEIRDRLKKMQDLEDGCGDASIKRRFISNADDQASLMWALRNESDDVARRHLAEVLAGAEFKRMPAALGVDICRLELQLLPKDSPAANDVTARLDKYEFKVRSADELIEQISEALDGSRAR